MRIMYVTTCLGAGGAQVQVCNLAESMSKKGHEVVVISLRDDIKIRPNDGVEVISLGMEKRSFTIIVAVFTLRKILNDFKPDIVHSHMIHANIFMRIMRLLYKMKCLVCTAHSSNEGGKYMMLLYRITDFLANLTTNVSREAVDIYLNKKASVKGKIISLYNGIDTNVYRKFNSNYFHKFYGLKPEAKVLLAIGRLTEAKDYQNLLNAFEKIKKNNVYLFIAGDGELEQELKLLAKNNTYNNNIVFMGKRSDIPNLLNACDTFVLSSKWEGFGLVVAEALACECNVVATDCGGVKEVLGDHGFLVDKMNSSALAIALEKSLELSKGSNKNGREYVRRYFDIEVIANKWERIYSTGANH